MRRTRLGLAVATALAATLLLPAPALAGEVYREESWRSPAEPWQVLGFSGEPDATTRGGTITVGEQTLVMLLEYAGESEWTGSANRLTGWDVEFRVRLGRDTTRSCLDDVGNPPPTLLWAGDHTGTVQLGLGVDGVCIAYPFEDRVTVPVDTRRWHRYRLEARGRQLRLAVDGRTVLDRTLTGTGVGTVALGFETHQGSSTWDLVRYDTAPGAGRCTVRGTDAADVLTGTPGDDVICAGGGDDRVDGLGGGDVLVGGSGHDVLLGGDGDDLLQGGWGSDVLDNGTGGGRSEGGQGGDRLTTGAVPDGPHQLVGGPGQDVADYAARTGGVAVTLDGVGGDGAPGEGDAVGLPAPWDRLQDVEEVRGGRGDDVLTGGAWADALVGGPGADLLRGGDGPDTLRGADGVEGNDRLDGGGGPDTCTADPADAMASCNDPDPRPTFPMPTPSPTASTPPPAGGPPPAARTGAAVRLPTLPAGASASHR